MGGPHVDVAHLTVHVPAQSGRVGSIGEIWGSLLEEVTLNLALPFLIFPFLLSQKCTTESP